MPRVRRRISPCLRRVFVGVRGDSLVVFLNEGLVALRVDSSDQVREPSITSSALSIGCAVSLSLSAQFTHSQQSFLLKIKTTQRVCEFHLVLTTSTLSGATSLSRGEDSDVGLIENPRITPYRNAFHPAMPLLIHKTHPEQHPADPVKNKKCSQHHVPSSIRCTPHQSTKSNWPGNRTQSVLLIAILRHIQEQSKIRHSSAPPAKPSLAHAKVFALQVLFNLHLPSAPSRVHGRVCSV